jgi:hypothetical protein
LVSIAVTPVSPSIAKGQTQQFTATGTYSDSSTQNLTTLAAWNSSNTATATITAAGLASGLAAGTSNITASLSGVTSPADVLTVTAATLQSIAVTPVSPSIAKGQTQQFTATGTYSDSSTQSLTSQATWTSSNTTTATITAAGLASGLAVGTSNITAALNGVTSLADVLTVTAATIIPAVTNVTSPAANGTYGVGATITITTTFSGSVTVTGTPLLALNSGGSASYTSGSGTGALTFNYVVGMGQNTLHLDEASTSALSLNGGSILASSGSAANLTLPTPGGAGSLGANSSIVIDTVAPAVTAYEVLWGSRSYNVTGTSRNRLPWEITGIRVVFSKPIANGNANSLSGVTTTGFSGLGTNTLTWTISPIAIGDFATALAGSGSNVLTDGGGNPLSGGAGFAQTLKMLWGDFNDDGVVNSLDEVGVNNATVQPYNVFGDMNGDGVVNSADVLIVRSRVGTSLP